MVDPQGGERVVDLCCGAGAALAALSDIPDVDLVGFDVSPAALRTAARTLQGLGHRSWQLAEGDLNAPLPMAVGAVDRALCDDRLQQLRDPSGLIGEVDRVLRPGGRLVLCRADLDTLTVTSDDAPLSRRLIRDYCDRVDGTLGRRLVDLVERSPLQVLDVHARVELSRRFRPGEFAHTLLQQLAATLRAAGTVDLAEVDRWLSGLGELDARDEFLFSVNDYAVVATRP